MVVNTQRVQTYG